jgi:hypothetical protein
MMTFEGPLWSAVMLQPVVLAPDSGCRMAIVRNTGPFRTPAWEQQVVQMCRGEVSLEYVHDACYHVNHLVLLYREERQIEAVAYVKIAFRESTTSLELDLLCSSVKGAGARLVKMLCELSPRDRIELFDKNYRIVRVEALDSLQRYYAALGFCVKECRHGCVRMTKALPARIAFA